MDFNGISIESLPSPFTKLNSRNNSENLQSLPNVYTANQSQYSYMRYRISNITNKCSYLRKSTYWQNLNQVGKVWTYTPLDIHYCIVPKVGCTFWKRIMRFIAQDYPSNQSIERPSDIDRTFVHFEKLQNLSECAVHNPILRIMMMSGKSFTFSRDPYSRLWSAYIDKFLLPDFWRTEAVSVIQRLRPNGTENEKSCANDVTFHEFLTFIKLTANSGLNEHWDNIHRLCSPCHVKYDVIGKLETFSQDADYILTAFGLDYLKETTTGRDMVRDEIETLTTYNFDLEPKMRKECFDKIEVARRLWIAFQYNGYIHRNISFPKDRFQSDEFQQQPRTVFIDIVFETLEHQKELGHTLKSQKRTMMLETYRSIPKSLLSDIAKVYEYDFELFGYNKNIL